MMGLLSRDGVWDLAAGMTQIQKVFNVTVQQHNAEHSLEELTTLSEHIGTDHDVLSFHLSPFCRLPVTNWDVSRWASTPWRWADAHLSLRAAYLIHWGSGYAVL